MIVSERTIVATIVGIIALVLTGWAATPVVLWTMLGTSLFWLLLIYVLFYSKPRKRRHHGDQESV